MDQYVYFLSNPSMPGLLKIGKTTTNPSKRAVELASSTGVPTPFRLECSLLVKDCHFSEKAAHFALRNFRKSKNREFFRIETSRALSIVLPLIGDYELDFARNSFEIKELELAIKRKEETIRAKLAAQAEEDQRRSREECAKRLLKIRDLESAVNQKKNELHSLGTKPTNLLGDMLGLASSICFFPFPIGWIFWVGCFSFLDPVPSTFAYICLSLIVFGGVSTPICPLLNKRYSLRVNPFTLLENEIFKMDSELDNLRQEEASHYELLKKFDLLESHYCEV